MTLNPKSWKSAFACVARAEEELPSLLTIAAPLLPLLLLTSPSLAQPYPVSILITPGTPEWGKPFEYSILVRAEKSVDALVKVTVYVPGRGWSEWRELWRGRLSAGESKQLSGKDERTPTALGDYVVWVSVDFASERDYALIGGGTYYASWSQVKVVSFAKREWEKCRELERDYWQLKRDYSGLELNYTLLKNEYARLMGACALLNISYSELLQKYVQLNSSYTSLNQSCTLFMRSYKLLSDRLERQRDELNTCWLAGLAALGLAVTAAVLAVEGWRKALSLAKKAGSTKES
jgi:hypothetical protein